MTFILHISYGDDFYEVYIKDNCILRITKYCGSSQFEREVAFQDLHPYVQEQILEKFV